MKRSITKAVSALSAAAALTLGLSACGVSEDSQKKVIDELQGRGFQEVTYVAQDAKTSDWLFTAKLDQCRIDIERDAISAQLHYRPVTAARALEVSNAVRAKTGNRVTETVNASFLREYATELGLQYCMKGVALAK